MLDMNRQEQVTNQEAPLCSMISGGCWRLSGRPCDPANINSQHLLHLLPFVPVSDLNHRGRAARNRPMDHNAFRLRSYVPYVSSILPGTNKCLDAFTVALNQACDGRQKRWYASTLELQLVSLEFCGACRSVKTLHVRVFPYTCPSLWSARQSHTTPDKGGLEVCISSRVPAVQAF
ncbi:unnamed protein product, partial [Ectocarpus fasciculatus]